MHSTLSKPYCPCDRRQRLKPNKPFRAARLSAQRHLVRSEKTSIQMSRVLQSVSNPAEVNSSLCNNDV